MLSTANFVCGLSAAFGLNDMTTRPSSVSASLMSRMRMRSLVLLDTRLSFSLTALDMGSKVSSGFFLLAALAAPRAAFPAAPPPLLPLLLVVGGGEASPLSTSAPAAEAAGCVDVGCSEVVGIANGSN